ncbi:MAG: hypothetical protein AAGF19_01750 [Pseudomonadota bacterium]
MAFSTRHLIQREYTAEIRARKDPMHHEARRERFLEAHARRVAEEKSAPQGFGQRTKAPRPRRRGVFTFLNRR